MRQLQIHSSRFSFHDIFCRLIKYLKVFFAQEENHLKYECSSLETLLVIFTRQQFLNLHSLSESKLLKRIQRTTQKIVQGSIIPLLF